MNPIEHKLAGEMVSQFGITPLEAEAIIQDYNDDQARLRKLAAKDWFRTQVRKAE